MKTTKLLFVLLLITTGLRTKAQELDVDIQIRPRFEFRNGYKTLRDRFAQPVSFISQRSRLGLTYKEDKLNVHFSLQNVSTWGDKLQGSALDKNSTGIFEANAYYRFNDFIGIKAGRQVLSYDNERIFGEANWPQAARAHDAVLIKIKPGENQLLDIGFALNSDGESLKKLPYQTNNYKSMEYAWYHQDFTFLSLSVLFLNAGYEIIEVDGGMKNEYQQTFGGFLKYKRNRIGADAAVYSQQGKRESQSLNAWYASLGFDYSIAKDLVAGLGMEYLSGTEQTDISRNTKSFIPLFGTNHAFNGAMDYFYVGNHQNSVGLQDFYGKFVYNQPKYSLQLKPHVFYAAESLWNNDEKMDNYLATELDISANYRVQKNLTLSLGYSQLFGTTSLEHLKGGDSSLSQNWAWLSLAFNPRFKILTN